MFSIFLFFSFVVDGFARPTAGQRRPSESMRVEKDAQRMKTKDGMKRTMHLSLVHSKALTNRCKNNWRQKAREITNGKEKRSNERSVPRPRGDAVSSAETTSASVSIVSNCEHPAGLRICLRPDVPLLRTGNLRRNNEQYGCVVSRTGFLSM